MAVGGNAALRGFNLFFGAMNAGLTDLVSGAAQKGAAVSLFDLACLSLSAVGFEGLRCARPTLVCPGTDLLFSSMKVPTVSSLKGNAGGCWCAESYCEQKSHVYLLVNDHTSQGTARGNWREICRTHHIILFSCRTSSFQSETTFSFRNSRVNRAQRVMLSVNA